MISGFSHSINKVSPHVECYAAFTGS